MRKESFVFHAEYIQDIPEELQPTYAMYAINYALKGIEPAFTDWRDIRDWNKVKLRIDTEINQWEEIVKARSEAGRNGGIKSGITRRSKRSTALENEANEAKFQTTKQNEAMLQNMQKNEANEAVYVSVNEFVNEYEFERENEQKKEKEQEKQNISLSPSVDLDINIPKDYAKQVFDILKDNNLPCCLGNYISFMQSDFKFALETLHSKADLRGLHSDMVLEALKNYALVINNPNTWQGWKNKKSFDRFVSWERFKDFLPDRFCLDNFLDRSTLPPKQAQNQTVGVNRALEILREVQNDQR